MGIDGVDLLRAWLIGVVAVVLIAAVVDEVPDWLKAATTTILEALFVVSIVVGVLFALAAWAALWVVGAFVVGGLAVAANTD